MTIRWASLGAACSAAVAACAASGLCLGRVGQDVQLSVLGLIDRPLSLLHVACVLCIGMGVSRPCVAVPQPVVACVLCGLNQLSQSTVYYASLTRYSRIAIRL